MKRLDLDAVVLRAKRARTVLAGVPKRELLAGVLEYAARDLRARSPIAAPHDETSRAWQRFARGVRLAGERLHRQTAGMSEVERADAYRALVRMMLDNLERFEFEGRHPRLTVINTPHRKWFLDNVDGHYLQSPLDARHTYRLRGHFGDACYTSITAYDGSASLQPDTSDSLKITSDQVETDAAGGFTLHIGAEDPGPRPWLKLGAGSELLWIRQFFDDSRTAKRGEFTIERVDPVAPQPVVDPVALRAQLHKYGTLFPAITALGAVATHMNTRQPNTVRYWSEMKGGAIYTSSDIDYMIGSWRLGPGEALVLRGRAAASRQWSIVLYSVFLDSLEQRERPISLSSGTAEVGPDGAYELVIAHQDPGHPNWLDTEERACGLFVLRWILPSEPTSLPECLVVPASEVRRP